jgi:hypothetical protein
MAVEQQFLHLAQQFIGPVQRTSGYDAIFLARCGPVLNLSAGASQRTFGVPDR